MYSFEFPFFLGAKWNGINKREHVAIEKKKHLLKAVDSTSDIAPCFWMSHMFVEFILLCFFLFISSSFACVDDTEKKNVQLVTPVKF